MFIKNVRIYTEEKKFRPGSIEVQDGRIAAIRYEEANADDGRPLQTMGQCRLTEKGCGAVSVLPGESEAVVDGRGCYALPGMIDMHFHGCKGWDICDLPDGESGEEAAAIFRMWQEISEYQASIGVTGMSPATMTLSADRLKIILKYAAAFARQQKSGKAGGARLAGINMEGPFISPARCGAQDASYILPCSKDAVTQFLEISEGLIKVVGIAPEKEDALPLISQMKNRVRCSLAHTDADYETARKALEAGACHVTHLFNAMPPWHHREPGVAGAVMDAAAEGKEIMAELICDGFHVHPSVIRTAFQLLGEDRIVLISDSMRAAGMPEGEYTLGGQEVVVQNIPERGCVAVLKKNGSLAGSTASLPDCVRTAVRKAGIPLEHAVAAATINPAKCLGIEKEQGTISVGKWADIVLWDWDLETRMVICRGIIL